MAIRSILPESPNRLQFPPIKRTPDLSEQRRNVPAENVRVHSRGGTNRSQIVSTFSKTLSTMGPELTSPGPTPARSSTHHKNLQENSNGGPQYSRMGPFNFPMPVPMADGTVTGAPRLMGPSDFDTGPT